MHKTKPYHQYTDYDKEPAGLRKLDFVVHFLEKYFAERDKTMIKVLDVGCGRGGISIPLASLGYHVLGIDLDVQSIESAKRKCGFKNAVFWVQDVMKLNLDEKFDCIIAFEVFEHVKEPYMVVKLLKNILAQDGILIISIPNGQSLEETIRKFTTHTNLGRKIKGFFKKRIKEEKIQTLAESPHLHFFSLSQFKKLLSKADLDIIAVKNTAAVFKESFYLFLRFFMRRGSRLFHFLDKMDNRLADLIPRWLGDGWMIAAKHKSKIIR